MKDDTEICSFSGLPFIPPCPVRDCPAWLEHSKSRCVFIETSYRKTKLTNFDLGRLFNLEADQVEEKVQSAKLEITDAMKILVPLMKTEPKGLYLDLKGEFFERLPIRLAQNQIDVLCQHKPVKAALRRRMLPGQFAKYVKNKKVKTHETQSKKNARTAPVRSHKIRGNLGSKQNFRHRG